jgi:hypothetical protein
MKKKERKKAGKKSKLKRLKRNGRIEGRPSSELKNCVGDK